MSDITVTGNQAYFNEDSKFFKDVYIYGTLHYNFEANARETFNDVVILGNLNVQGTPTFSSDIYLDNNLSVGILTVRNRLDVGIGGTILTTSTGRIGIGSTQPLQSLDITGSAIVSEKVGIGSTNPEQKLDILGSVKIDEFIYDSVNSPGLNGYYLSMDAAGIRWTAFQPSFSPGIFVQDEGVYIPTTGIAKSFTALNFTQINSLGIGTDNLIPIVSPSNPSFIADIQTQDYWGFTSTGNIYRMTSVGIQNSNPTRTLDITGTLHATEAVDFDSTLNVDGDTVLQSTLNVKDATDLDSTLNVDGATVLQTTLNVKGATDLDTTLNVDGATVLQTTLNVKGATDLDSSLNVDGATVLQSTLNAKGATDLDSTLNVDGAAVFQTTLNVKGATDLDTTLNVDGAAVLQTTLNVKGATDLDSTLNVDGDVTFTSTTQSSDKDTGALITQGGVGIEKNLNVGGNTKLIGTLELDSSLIDINGSTAVGKTDYRLSSVGTGVSWRPPGVQTQNAIWVTMDGNDTNSGYLEGDAKRTIGAAASIAQEGDTIFVRSGVYYENNPIGLRTDVSVSGQDLRLVTVVPNNVTKDVFHVRRGCLIENLNFAGSNVSVAHTGCGAVAFPPLEIVDQAISGYIGTGPANEGPSGRWRSPYIRNCTNFMTGSIGMKINGNHANAAFTGINSLGQDLKCMVCDSFTQYNENGIGVSITNNGYAQLVSIFTINCNIGVYCDTGGSCDITNSNSSFGNYGLYADGVGATEFTGITTGSEVLAEEDTYIFTNVKDILNNVRKPFDGQALFFKINLADYNDVGGATGIVTAPLRTVRSVRVTNGGSGYSETAPPNVTISSPGGPESILAELSANVSAAGTISSIDVIASGRNFLPDQPVTITIGGGGGATAEAIMDPIYFTVSGATEPTNVGLTTVTFNEFIPYSVGVGVSVEFRRISRIITSNISLEYIGSGVDINRANPFQGGVPIPENEVVAINGGQVPFTSTDQKGNFRIGQGLTIDQTTSTISGRDFNRAIQANLTPLILALGG